MDFYHGKGDAYYNEKFTLTFLMWMGKNSLVPEKETMKAKKEVKGSVKDLSIF